ncbi:MAG: ABC transporter substrate-binding protein [SAR324 cluster bacterium]|nr:ABC transporter substrate-binding protein [SAR324 cluster bacterium]
MMGKPVIKAAHLKITDHLILGVTKAHADTGIVPFKTFDLETRPMVGWNQVGDAMKDGSVDVAFMLAPMAIDLFHAGVGIKLSMFAHKTGSIFVKNKKANIQKLEDFKGKMIAIPYQLSVHNMLLHQLFTRHGMSVGAGKDVALEVMAPSQMPEAIQYDEDGEIGGFIVAEPFGSQAIKEGYAEEMYLSRDLWPKHPCCVVVIKEKLIDSHPEAVQELTQSLVNSGKFVKDNPQGAIKIGAQFLSQKEEVVMHVLTDTPDRVLISSELFPVLSELEKIQEYMCNTMGVMHSKINLEKFVESSFAKNAGAT